MFSEESANSLVVQWLKICLLLHGIQVSFLLGELRSDMLTGN